MRQSFRIVRDSLATALAAVALVAPSSFGTATASSPAPASTATVGKPAAPVIGKVTPGMPGGKATATVRWSAPKTTRGVTITGYRVRFTRYNSKHVAVAGGVSAVLPASARSYVYQLDKGLYRFDVHTVTSRGVSDWSRPSAYVTTR